MFRTKGSLLEDQHTWLKSRSILFRIKSVSDYTGRENRNTHFMFSITCWVAFFFYVLLTLHLCIIFFQMKLTSCTLLLSIFISNSLHVSDNYVPIIRRTTVSTWHWYFSLYWWLSGLLFGIESFMIRHWWQSLCSYYLIFKIKLFVSEVLWLKIHSAALKRRPKEANTFNLLLLNSTWDKKL